MSSAGLLIVVGLLGWVYWPARSEGTNKLLEQARMALSRKDYSEAEKLARRCIQIDPESATAFHLAGQAAAHQEKFQAAVDYYDRMPNDGSSDYVRRSRGSRQYLAMEAQPHI